MHIVHAGYLGETKSYYTITKLTCYSYLVWDDGISESSDTAEESAGRQKSDIDEHDDLSGMSGCYGLPDQTVRRVSWAGLSGMSCLVSS